MTETNPEFVKRRNRGRWMLILLAVVFIGPLLAAFALYYGEIWAPQGMAVNGELISPPRPTPELRLAGRPGDEASSQLRQLWSLLLVAPGDCDDTCRTALYETRQMRRSLGKETDRVQRVWVMTSALTDPDFVEQEHADLITIAVTQPGQAELLNVIGPTLPGEVFVVDPHGNLMMRFPPGSSMRAMYTDIKRLLKVSRIG